MSEWIEQREAFSRIAVQQGLNTPAEIDRAFPLGYNVPPTRLEKWLRKLTAYPKDAPLAQKLVNRFKLGADPEFVLIYDHDRVNASALKLSQGLAFGADNNGRLVEIRPWPSRSAVEVLASMLATLRWFELSHPAIQQYQWIADALTLDDGLGGHVHFGRKRPNRDAEVTALDTMEELLVALGAYNAGNVMRRRQNRVDIARHQNYGQLHDFRLQAHGYEYRTWPSWLDSPSLAFLTMVVSKLAVYNPELAKGIGLSTSREANYSKLRNLLGYYKGADDDARLALLLLGRGGVPQQIGGDFKIRWGLDQKPTAEVRDKAIHFIPSAIKPSKSEIEEVFQHLATGKPIGWKTPVPSWTPVAPPTDYFMAINNVQTVGMKGLGELVWDLCLSRKAPLEITGGPRDNYPRILVPSKYASLMPPEFRKQVKADRSGNTVYINQNAREGAYVSQTRHILLSGFLPIWRVKDAAPDSFEQWQAATSGHLGKKYSSKILVSEGKMPIFG